MVKLLKQRKGQSILEYLIISTVIVGAILVAKGKVQTGMNDLYTKAGDKTQKASNALGSLDFSQPK